MNAVTTVEEKQVRVVEQQPTPASMLAMALQQGAGIDMIERLMALQATMTAAAAKSDYDRAFAAFKAESIHIFKGRKVTDGPLKGKSYAELHDVVNAVTPALSKHGLSFSWKLTKDDRDWLEITCTVSHVGGHSERVSMGGPPDAGGAKNAIQARASAITYLSRYTLKAALGVAEENDDTDGNGPVGFDLAGALHEVDTAATWEALEKSWKALGKEALKAGAKPAYDQLKQAVLRRQQALRPAVAPAAAKAEGEQA